MLNGGLLVDLLRDLLQLVETDVNTNELAAVPPILSRHRKIDEITQFHRVFHKVLVLDDEDTALLCSFESSDQSFLCDCSTTSSSSNICTSCVSRGSASFRDSHEILVACTDNKVIIVLALIEECAVFLKSTHAVLCVSLYFYFL